MWRARLAPNFSEIRLLIHPRAPASAGARAFAKENLSELLTLNVGLDLAVVEGQEQKARLIMQDHLPHIHAFCLENDSPDLIAQKMHFATEFVEKKRALMAERDAALKDKDPAKYAELIARREKASLKRTLKTWHMETARLMDLYTPRKINFPQRLQHEMDIKPIPDFVAWQAAKSAAKSARA